MRRLLSSSRRKSSSPKGGGAAALGGEEGAAHRNSASSFAGLSPTGASAPEPFPISLGAIRAGSELSMAAEGEGEADAERPIRTPVLTARAASVRL